jgi:hypothetical protein
LSEHHPGNSQVIPLKMRNGPDFPHFLPEPGDYEGNGDFTKIRRIHFSAPENSDSIYGHCSSERLLFRLWICGAESIAGTIIDELPYP